MKTLIPINVQLSQEDAPKRAFWYQNQYAIANRFGSPNEYLRGRIVLKRGDNFYIKPVGKKESVAVHQSKAEFFSEDGKRQLSEAQIKELLRNGDKL